MSREQDRAALDRLMDLRPILFSAIDKEIAEDGHHKSYEGRLSVIWPHRFADEYRVELSCYVLGPSRHYEWEGKSMMEAVTAAERDMLAWCAAAMSEGQEG